MKFAEKLKNIFLHAEDLLMTNHSCISCGKEVPDGTKFSLCKSCIDSLDKIDGKTCAKCGETLGADVLICDACKERDYVFRSNKSIFYYSDAAATIIKNLKYGGKKYITKIVAEMMTETMEVFAGIDLILFVPTSKTRKRERGFNQAEVIANEISKIVGIKVVDALFKDNSSKSQAGLKREDRLKSIKGSIHLNSEVSDEIKGKNVLIIDDVFTTGSTLNECAKEILKAKPKEVRTLTFAKTKYVSLKS